MQTFLIYKLPVLSSDLLFCYLVLLCLAILSKTSHHIQRLFVNFSPCSTMQHIHSMTAQMEMATSTHPALSDQAIMKLAPPLHPPASVQCRCGQLVPISGNQVSRSFPLHHIFSSFISQFITLSFPFPRQLFSCFTSL